MKFGTFWRTFRFATPTLTLLTDVDSSRGDTCNVYKESGEKKIDQVMY